MNLKNKIVIVFGILILIGIGFRKMIIFQDYNPTVVIERDEFQNIRNKELLEGEKITGEFKAKNNNLGIISVFFNTHNRVNDDYLQFKIKEKGNTQWYYSNKYKVDQFQNNQYFSFGFPQINDSKGKKYQIEIESLIGADGNSVQMVNDMPFLSKYSFPKAYLLQNKSEIPIFIFNKTVSFFSHINLNVYLFILLFSLSTIYLSRLININKLLFFFKKNKLFLKKFSNKIVIFSNRIITKEKINIPIILLISTFSSLIVYKLFFLFSQVIWSKNLKIDFNDLSSQMYSWVILPGQRDGIETYVLYVLVFLCIFLTILLVWLYDYLRRFHRHIFIFFYFLILILSVYFYFSKIGFYPPMSNPVLKGIPFALILIIMTIPWFLIKLAYKNELITNLLIGILLIPICFIATSPISSTDYSYIFAPALRILNHFEIKDIYFQYDILLSLIAVLWMKLSINLNLFQIVGQFSFYILFLASFLFSKKFFIKKQLAYYLLVSLVLVKIYGLISDPILDFQTTPLRLDWWLLILVLSFNKGIYNKLLGFSLSLLVIFHRTFGLIYTIGYLEIIAVLFLLEFLSGEKSVKSFKIKIKKTFFLCLPNIALLISSLIISSIIFGKASLEAASIYRKIGVGFMPISTISFYWYFFVLISATVVILIKKRKNLSTNYFNSSLLLIVLSIGNSIYFFGRSHENNIINISASLIFVLFLFFDLVINIKNKKKKLLILLPNFFILLIIFYYSAGILSRVQIQFRNLQKGQNIYSMSINANSLGVDKVKKFTNFSNKVYFIGGNDFYYYYYGSYVPEGRYSPYLSWVYKSDIQNFIQNLLNKGYYIVSPPLMYDEALFSKLIFNKSITKDGFKIVWNENYF